MSDMRFLTTTEIIERLKATINGIGNRVGGADNFDDIDDNARLETPAIYVTLGDCTASNDSLQTGMQQTIRHEFEIILHIEKTDRRGQFEDAVALKMRMALLRALNGWLPDPGLSTSPSVNCHSTVLFFAGDNFISEDRANYFRNYIFAQEYTFDSSEDALGMLGNYDDLDDFDSLCLDIIIDPDTDVQDVQIVLTDIHE